jgi:lipid-A-disaccharide synthase
MMERLQARKIEAERDPNLIGLFPGSRLREVRKIFPVMLETARQLRKGKRNLRFEVAAASEHLAHEISKLLATGSRLLSWRREGRVRGAAQEDPQVIRITVGQAAEIMQRAWVGIVASGSATLEAAYFRLPFVLIYKVAWLTYLAARLVVNVKYLGMPNLLAGKEVLPEFIQRRAEPGAIGKAVQPLIENANARDRIISEFDAIVGKLQGAAVTSPLGRSEDSPSLMRGSGASQKAARAIIEEIRSVN